MRLGKVHLPHHYVVDLDNATMVDNAWDALHEDISQAAIQNNLHEYMESIEDDSLSESDIADFLKEEPVDYAEEFIKDVPKIMWWGYLHQNNTIQVKRWFGDHKDYTEDCEGNEFVQKVVAPFEAKTREEAVKILTERLNK